MHPPSPSLPPTVAITSPSRRLHFPLLSPSLPPPVASTSPSRRLHFPLPSPPLPPGHSLSPFPHPLHHPGHSLLPFLHPAHPFLHPAHSLSPIPHPLHHPGHSLSPFPHPLHHPDLLFERQQPHLLASSYPTHYHSQPSPWNFASSSSPLFGDPFLFDNGFDSSAGNMTQRRRNDTRKHEIARKQQAHELDARRNAAYARGAQHDVNETKIRQSQHQEQAAAHQIPVQHPANNSSKRPETPAASPMAGVAGISAAEIARVSSLSADDAARKLQAVWRGYSVRQGKPLELARSIADVRKLVHEMDAQLRDNEFVAKMVSDPMGKLRVSETIMSWLFRLDEVQSPNQDVRNLRRDMARKLTKLLDRVDILTNTQPQEAEAPLEVPVDAGVTTMGDAGMDVDPPCEDSCHCGSQCSDKRCVSCESSDVARSTHQVGRVAKRQKQRHWRDALWQWKERMAGKRGGAC
ncbi:unnamed protein product [Closterium sp. NIES-54]